MTSAERTRWFISRQNGDIMKNGQTVLLYNIRSDRGMRIRTLCVKMGFKIRSIEKEQYSRPIGYLAGLDGFADSGESFSGEGFDDEMMIMSGFTGTALSMFLDAFKKNKIAPVALKAVITETNKDWDSIMLHDELTKERAALTRERGN